MKISKYLILLLFIFGTKPAISAPITYEGELFDGITSFGEISDSDSDWWFFDANAGDVISLAVNRLENNLDPAMNLYFGFGDTLNLSQVAYADDNLAELPGLEGPFADPIINYTIATTGTYSANVWDFLSGPGAPFDYQITLNGANPIDVPEPSIFALFGLGLIGLGFARKNRKKA